MFGAEAVGWTGTVNPLVGEMTDAPDILAKIVKKYGLKEANLDRLATAWHTDLDLGRPIEVMTDMTKSREAGFTKVLHRPL